MKLIPESHRDLLTDDVRAFACLATVMANGAPQVTPIWFNIEGDAILINSAKGRVKDRNIRARPQVALAISDPRNPYRYLQIRGTVVEITEEGGVEHIDALSEKYTGNPVYKVRPGEIRVTYKILPNRVSCMG